MKVILPQALRKDNICTRGTVLYKKGPFLHGPLGSASSFFVLVVFNDISLRSNRRRVYLVDNLLQDDKVLR